jgi:hypothetical protein
MSEDHKVGGGGSSPRIQAIPIVTPLTKEKLTSRQLVDYEEHRRSFIEWLVNLGKKPERAEGYAQETARVRALRADQFYRWVWEEEGQYTTAVTHDHADAYMKKLAYDDTNGSKANNESDKDAVPVESSGVRRRGMGARNQVQQPHVCDEPERTPDDGRTKEVREAAPNYGSVLTTTASLRRSGPSDRDHL